MFSLHWNICFYVSSYPGFRLCATARVRGSISANWELDITISSQVRFFKNLRYGLKIWTFSYNCFLIQCVSAISFNISWRHSFYFYHEIAVVLLCIISGLIFYVSICVFPCFFSITICPVFMSPLFNYVPIHKVNFKLCYVN